MNFTTSIATNETGTMICEIDPKDLDSILITPNQDSYIGFGDLSQAVYPIPAQSHIEITHRDFKVQTLERILALIRRYIFRQQQVEYPHMGEGLPVRIYGKRQVAGSITFYIAYLGGNL